MNMTKAHEFRSECPLASALDVLGDKWTLLIIRDLARNKCTYGELEKLEENITTNILADRLKKLTAFELVEKSLYQEKPKRYHYLLTQKGKALLPILRDLADWGREHICDHEDCEILDT
jgi:DNA-binding HxlR family transcriptional regulator